MLCLLLLLPSTASIAALNEEETRSWKKGCKAQVMSWNINLIFESFLSLFLACFRQACLSNYSSIAKGRLKGQSLGSSLAGTWAGVAWGAGAEQSSLCAVRDPVSVHAVTALVCRRGFLLSPVQLSPAPLLTCFLQTLGN